VHAAALSWLSRGDEAEAILVDLADSATDTGTLALAQLHRTGNLLWTMARPDDAREALAAAAATGAAPLHVAAMSLALAAAVGELSAVLARGPQLLHDELPDDLARILVASAVSAAAAVTGEPVLLDEAAVRGGLTTDHAPTGIPGFGLADLQVLGHRLAGRPGPANDLARRMQLASADLPGPARLMGLVVAGHAALAGGRVGDALLLLREAWPGLADSGHEFRFRCRTLLATALGMAGQPAQAAPLLAGIVAGQHPAYRLYAPDDLLARAWGAAAEGSTTESLGHAVAAADLARETGAPPTRCSPGRPLSSSAPRLRRCPASRNWRGSVVEPRWPVPTHEPVRTKTARRSSWPPALGPSWATWSPPATRRPRPPASTVGGGGTARPCPPRLAPRSWLAGPVPAPRPWRALSDRCR
jgi:hypothetical protein